MIRLENICKYYNYEKPNQTIGVENVSLSIQRGEMVAIMGPSGSGKTTLLNVLRGGNPPQNGTYYYDNVNVYSLSERERSKLRNEQIGIIMQDFALVEEYSVLENILIPFCFRKGTRINKKELNKKVVDALKKVGIEKLKDKLVSELSGGEQQRVAIARVLCQETKVILADEPTGALDETNSENIMTIFKNLNKEGITIIIVTHDETIAKSCNRIINIIDGHIIN